MKLLTLEGDKCSVLIAEFATGHVVKKDLTLYLNGDSESEVFYVFDSFSSAKEFARSFVKSKPGFECSIFNCHGGHLITFDINGERKFRNND